MARRAFVFVYLNCIKHVKTERGSERCIGDLWAIRIRFKLLSIWRSMRGIRTAAIRSDWRWGWVSEWVSLFELLQTEIETGRLFLLVIDSSITKTTTHFEGVGSNKARQFGVGIDWRNGKETGTSSELRLIWSRQMTAKFVQTLSKFFDTTNFFNKQALQPWSFRVFVGDQRQLVNRCSSLRGTATRRLRTAAAADAFVIWLTMVVGCHSYLRIPTYIGTVIPSRSPGREKNKG